MWRSPIPSLLWTPALARAHGPRVRVVIWLNACPTKPSEPRYANWACLAGRRGPRQPTETYREGRNRGYLSPVNWGHRKPGLSKIMSMCFLAQEGGKKPHFAFLVYLQNFVELWWQYWKKGRLPHIPPLYALNPSTLSIAQRTNISGT